MPGARSLLQWGDRRIGTEIAQGMTEVLAYGTAVIVEPEHSAI
jgi:hypothetical protein